MEIVIYIIAFVFLYYGLQIGLLYYGFSNVPKFNPKNLTSTHNFSIIIPFRNEENNLIDFLDSISKLNYNPTNFELIFVNDASTDNSLQIINKWRFQNPFIPLTILDNVLISNSPKKDAITRALTIAKFNWILVTDADCILPEKLLQFNSAYLTENPDKQFVIGGVAIKTNKSFWSKYQSLDLATLQAVTIGSFGIGEAFICNGANMLYSKSLFNKVNGYAGVNHIASGDDVFLLQKVKDTFPETIGCLLNKDAIVYTKPVNNFIDIINQRTRWGKKATAYKNLYPKLIGVLVVLTNLGLLILLLSLFIFNYNVYNVLSVVLIKFLVDFIFLYKYSKPFKISLAYFIPSFLIYPVIILFVIIKSVFGKLVWKDRAI